MVDGAAVCGITERIARRIYAVFRRRQQEEPHFGHVARIVAQQHGFADVGAARSNDPTPSALRLLQDLNRAGKRDVPAEADALADRIDSMLPRGRITEVMPKSVAREERGDADLLHPVWRPTS
jgi:hypothetical protein